VMSNMQHIRWFGTDHIEHMQTRGSEARDVLRICQGLLN
jgi:hypothetical protein